MWHARCRPCHSGVWCTSKLASTMESNHERDYVFCVDTVVSLWRLCQRSLCSVLVLKFYVPYPASTAEQ